MRCTAAPVLQNDGKTGSYTTQHQLQDTTPSSHVADVQKVTFMKDVHNTSINISTALLKVRAVMWLEATLVAAGPAANQLCIYPQASEGNRANAMLDHQTERARTKHKLVVVLQPPLPNRLKRLKEWLSINRS